MKKVLGQTQIFKITHCIKRKEENIFCVAKKFEVKLHLNDKQNIKSFLAVYCMSKKAFLSIFIYGESRYKNEQDFVDIQ